MRDDMRSELSDNLWPITAKLEDWEPSCDHEREALECHGSKEAAWLSEMDFASIESVVKRLTIMPRYSTEFLRSTTVKMRRSSPNWRLWASHGLGQP